MEDRTPENGYQVCYVDEHGFTFDALIQAVLKDGTVNLRVPDTFDVRHVSYNSDKEPSTWHWPDEE